jgi:hypothetical protein
MQWDVSSTAGKSSTMQLLVQELYGVFLRVHRFLLLSKTRDWQSRCSELGTQSSCFAGKLTLFTKNSFTHALLLTTASQDCMAAMAEGLSFSHLSLQSLCAS